MFITHIYSHPLFNWKERVKVDDALLECLDDMRSFCWIR